jgi:chromosome segregation ATPase
MALGTRAGHTSNGIPYPVSAANVAKSGKNVYLNTALSGTPFNKQSNIENQAFSGGGSSLHDTYVQNAQSVINKQTNPQVKAYLTYQLQTYQYQNGMISNKPKTVPKPTGTSASDLQSAETAEANARRQLQQTQNAIATAKVQQAQANLVSTQTANINAQTSSAMSTIDAQQTNINSELTRVQNMISSYKTANPGKPIPSGLTDALNNVQSANTRLATQRQQVQTNATNKIAQLQSQVVPPSNQNASVSTQSPKVLPVAKPVVTVQNKTQIVAPSTPALKAPSK